MNIIIKLTPEEAKQILKDLPGGPELWETLAEVFITTWNKEGGKDE